MPRARKECSRTLTKLRPPQVLNRVDVVVEVRDARIPASTTHPMVDAWLQNRNTKRVVALNKVDMVPRSAVSMWEAYLENSLKIPSCLVNGKTGGKGIDQLTRLIQSRASAAPPIACHCPFSAISFRFVSFWRCSLDLLVFASAHSKGWSTCSTQARAWPTSTPGALTIACHTLTCSFLAEAGKEINERREARGMMPRNPRVAVMGYPNVGKSGILNRLSGRSGAKVKSENKAGVTRHMQWVRTENFDLLDSPGIIPAKLVTQEVAVHLAICDDIGQASYDTTLVAAALIDEMRKVQSSMRSYCDCELFPASSLSPFPSHSAFQVVIFDVHCLVGFPVGRHPAASFSFIYFSLELCPKNPRTLLLTWCLAWQ